MAIVSFFHHRGIVISKKGEAPPPPFLQVPLCGAVFVFFLIVWVLLCETRLNKHLHPQTLIRGHGSKSRRAKPRGIFLPAVQPLRPLLRRRRLFRPCRSW